MGLSIGYRFEFRGGKRELLGKLEWLRECFAGLPVEGVGEVVDIRLVSMEMGYGKHKGERFQRNALGFMMAWSYFDPSAPERALEEIVKRAGGVTRIDRLAEREKRRYGRLRREAQEIWVRRKDRMCRSGNGVSLEVDVGPGCEHFKVTLARLGKGKLWRGMRCTKTQYAEHFVDAHLAVISMLDLCREAGILKSVHDEGEYWQTRDLDVLARNINASTDMIRMMSEAFKAIGRKRGYEVDSAVDRSANYVRSRSDSARRRQKRT